MLKDAPTGDFANTLEPVTFRHEEVVQFVLQFLRIHTILIIDQYDFAQLR